VPDEARGVDTPAQPDAVIAGWAPVGAPYRALRAPLATAEQRLNDTTDPTLHPAWQQLRDATGDDQACVAAVDRLLAALLGSWRLVPVGDRWRVALTGQPAAAVGDPAAVQALVLLVESAGWSRLKPCAHPDCHQVFLDWTNGGNRRDCRAHRPPRVEAPVPSESSTTMDRR